MERKLIAASWLLAATVALALAAAPQPTRAGQLEGETSVGRSDRATNLFSIVKQASRQSASYLADLLTSIPLTKILLAGGALLSVFFMFVRLVVVLGPILVLGALTRESTDASDFLKMMIEFYNQVVVALDEQQQHQPQAK